ncbi:hypothetical protein AWB78_01305 [Caballeronia calidae]|uniref:Uncharacterized protein n=1 Tax=Caballeronia calidae TaxID=1777139 RepID=A0A158A688_9BURK|nr:hypothetical protein [Caballeronia calidae]SAK53219.1 hypothetical protein AWB78_01305 [Caballeronia calidae]
MSARPITDTLRLIGGGTLIDTASDQMNDLVRAIDENGGTGKLVIEVTVKKATRGGAMLVTGKTTLKKPADEPMEAMLFATPDGNLLADDPRQQKLDLKRVESASDAPPVALKTAS